MTVRWSGCPNCKDCTDRTPYSKCTETCSFYAAWKIEHDRVKQKEKSAKRLYNDISGHRTEMVVKARKRRRDKMF